MRDGTERTTNQEDVGAIKLNFNFLSDRQNAGSALSVVGSAIGTIGSIINTVWFAHNAAILIWMVSNPILLIWAIGGQKKWWNGGLSYSALIVMYITFTLSGVYAVYIWGIL